MSVQNDKPSAPRLLINGKFVEASDKGTFTLINPATREKLTQEIPEATEADADAAVAAAKAAFPSWSALAPQARGKYFKKLAALLRSHSDELAYLEAISVGRPVAHYFDAAGAADHFDHYAEAWPEMHGLASLNTPGHVTMTMRQPYGVVAVIIPWNVSVYFLGSKAAPALMAGNTVVLKSSEKAPLAVARVAELVVEAGFPPGVFNILSGHGVPSGAVLAAHMDVRALSFTGSTRTGRLIQEMAAKSNLKMVVLELGGKSPAIVFEDADLGKAARQLRHSIIWNSGQVCMASTRLYVQRSVATAFVEAFKKQMQDEVKVGDPTDRSVNYGPQADGVQYKNVVAYLEEGTKTAGSIALGGNGTLEQSNGYFIEPTIFLDAPEGSRITKEEIFGSVVILNTFDTETEAVEKANATEYGLYASVYTKDLSRAMRVSKALESGYVGVNCTSPSAAPYLPFGGYKGSGQGREGWLHSLDKFLETKSVIIEIDAE